MRPVWILWTSSSVCAPTHCAAPTVRGKLHAEQTREKKKPRRRGFSSGATHTSSRALLMLSTDLMRLSLQLYLGANPLLTAPLCVNTSWILNAPETDVQSAFEESRWPLRRGKCGGPLSPSQSTFTCTAPIKAHLLINTIFQIRCLLARHLWGIFTVCMLIGVLWMSRRRALLVVSRWRWSDTLLWFFSGKNSGPNTFDAELKKNSFTNSIRRRHLLNYGIKVPEFGPIYWFSLKTPNDTHSFCFGDILHTL